MIIIKLIIKLNYYYIQLELINDLIIGIIILLLIYNIKNLLLYILYNKTICYI